MLNAVAALMSISAVPVLVARGLHAAWVTHTPGD
jgi:hypothetical protein